MALRSPILRALGQVIAARRREIDGGIAQEELALRCGLDRSYIGGVERGERNVSFHNMCKIALVLGMSPSELLERFEGNIGWESVAAGGLGELRHLLQRSLDT